MTFAQEYSVGVLVLHTGSPDAPAPAAVRAYLKRFLMDPYVLSMPYWIRWMLVHGLIAPLRASRSAEKYRAIWMDEGAPLVVHTQRFTEALQDALPEYAIASGSAYGIPTVADGIADLLHKGTNRIVVLPMFPHFAGATRGSLGAAVAAAASTLGGTPPQIITVPPFYDAPPYIEAMCRFAAPMLATLKPDQVIFSYHGLPLRQARALPDDGSPLNYEDQCLRSTETLSNALELEPSHCHHAYQSRFGRGWLGPTLEDTLIRLAGQGCRRVAVLAPSFVTDCLETLEELDIGGKRLFIEAGGESFMRIPALNNHPAWVSAAAALVTASAAGAADSIA